MEVGFTIATQPKCEKKIRKMIFPKTKASKFEWQLSEAEETQRRTMWRKMPGFSAEAKKPTDRITNKQNYGKRIKNDEDEDIFLIKKAPYDLRSKHVPLSHCGSVTKQFRDACVRINIAATIWFSWHFLSSSSLPCFFITHSIFLTIKHV